MVFSQMKRPPFLFQLYPFWCQYTVFSLSHLISHIEKKIEWISDMPRTTENVLIQHSLASLFSYWGSCISSPICTLTWIADVWGTEKAHRFFWYIGSRLQLTDLFNSMYDKCCIYCQGKCFLIKTGHFDSSHWSWSYVPERLFFFFLFI